MVKRSTARNHGPLVKCARRCHIGTRGAHYLAMQNLITRLFVGAMVITAAACGGGGGDGGGDDDGSNTPMPDAGTQQACAGAVDIDGSAPQNPGTGTLELEGTITLPAMPAGTKIELEVMYHSDGYFVDNVAPKTLAAGKTSLTYRYTNLPSDTTELRIGLFVDANGNGTLGESADYVGWFDGTATAPITNSDNAVVVTMTGACTTGVNFAVGTP